MNIVLQRELMDDTGNWNELGSGDNELIQIVSRWGDNRLAKHLMDALPGITGDVYSTSDLMDMIAELVDDDELLHIAKIYADVRYKEDVDVVETEESADPEVGVVEGSGDQAAETNESVSGDANSKGAAEEPEVQKATYKEFRGDLVARFMQRSVIALALAESRQMEKERASK